MTENFATRWVNDIATATRKCVLRFPATVFFIVALTAWCIYLQHSVPDDGNLYGVILYYFSVGIPLSIMLQLWSEELACKSRKLILQVVGQALLLADAILLYSFNHISIIIGVAHASVIVAIVVALFLISFYREKNDVACWNFTARTLVAYVKAAFTGLLLCGGICLLLLSLDILFDVEFDPSIYFDTLIVCYIGLAHIYFIGMLPAGEAKHDRQPKVNNFLNLIVRFVLIPLVACYLIVLYAYGLHILFAWELPNGWVSWLVTALMAGCLIIEAGLYPFRQLPDKKRANELIARYLPLLILPLLILMTIGIIRRIDDYGVTINRLYVLIFNLWCYGVCITLFATQARRIGWIPASFAAIFLLTSVLPGLNISQITLNAIRGELSKAIEETCSAATPLNNEQYEAWLQSLPSEEARQINDKVEYLKDLYDESEYSHLVSKDAYFTSGGVYDYESCEFCNFNVAKSQHIEIPADATYMKAISGLRSKPVPKGKAAPVALNATDTVYIDAATLRKLNVGSSGKPYDQFQQSNDNFKFVITNFSASLCGDSISIWNINGYLFTKNINNNEQATTDR